MGSSSTHYRLPTRGGHRTSHPEEREGAVVASLHHRKLLYRGKVQELFYAGLLHRPEKKIHKAHQDSSIKEYTCLVFGQYLLSPNFSFNSQQSVNHAFISYKHKHLKHAGKRASTCTKYMKGVRFNRLFSSLCNWLNLMMLLEWKCNYFQLWIKKAIFSSS